MSKLSLHLNSSKTFLHALERAAEGVFWIHPLHDTASGKCSCNRKPEECRPGKEPRRRGYNKLTDNDPERIERDWSEFPTANIGGVVQSGYVVLDEDPRHGGDLALAELERKYGPLPVTVTVETAGDGKHRYFRLPTSFIPANAKYSLAGNGLELLCCGWNIVLPGSVVHGREYRYAEGKSPSDRNIAELPKWIVDILIPPSEPPPERKRTEATNTPRKLIIPTRILKGTRHHTLASLAGTLLNYGVRDSTLADELIAIDRERCVPPLGEREARRVAKSIQQTHDHKEKDAEQKSKSRSWILEVTQAAIANPQKWRGAKGKSKLAALLGALAIAYKKHTDTVPAPFRSIAEHGQVTLKTTYPAVKDLVEDGWLRLYSRYRKLREELEKQNIPLDERRKKLAEASNIYTLSIPRECRTNKTWCPTGGGPYSSSSLQTLLYLCGTEVFRNRGLGKSGLLIVAALMRGPGKSRRQLSLEAEVSPDTAERFMKKALMLGIVTETEKGIELVDSGTWDLELIAKRLGTFGKGQRDKERHQDQRTKYRRRLGIVDAEEQKNEEERKEWTAIVLPPEENETTTHVSEALPDPAAPKVPVDVSFPLSVEQEHNLFVGTVMSVMGGGTILKSAFG